MHQAGDIKWLAENTPFTDGDSAPLIEHLRRAPEDRFADRGEHGLLRMHDGDWTGPMNGPRRRGFGGSGLATTALAYAARLLAPLAEAYGDDALTRRCADIADVLNTTTWDQLWASDRFAYGIDADGRRFVDVIDRRVRLNPRSWGILRGSAHADHAQACASTVDEHLATRCGTTQPEGSRWHRERKHLLPRCRALVGCASDDGKRGWSI